jgi:hypothetical protein
MADFKHRAGVDRTVQEVTVRLYDKAGFEFYSRTMESGVIKNFKNYIRTVLDTLVMVDKYEDIGFGDMDMCAEVNGHLLNIEFKGSFERVGLAQIRQAVNLAETSKVTTLFVEGNPDNPKRIFTVSHVATFNESQIKDINGIDELNVYISEWQRYALKQKGVKGTEANKRATDLYTAIKNQVGGF